MVKTLSILSLACLIVASLSLAAPAASFAAAGTVAAKSEAAKPMMKISGTVEKVDLKAHSVTLNTGAETKTYTFGTKTVYMQGGKKVKSSMLKNGEKVEVYPDVKNMIHKIEIESVNPSSR